MNLIASTSTFGFFTLISRILGYVRDILIAIFLGTSLFADAFFVAFRLPNTFRRLFAEGTFNAAFIPSYAGELAKNTASPISDMRGTTEYRVHLCSVLTQRTLARALARIQESNN